VEEVLLGQYTVDGRSSLKQLNSVEMCALS